MIESPGFPHHYPESRDCRWDFVAEYGKRFQFIFTYLDIEPHYNCSFDYLEFKDSIQVSSDSQSNLIARFCNWTSSQDNTVPPPITTSGSFASVHFHSDPGIGAKGFQLVYNQVAGICGGLLTGSSGTIRPPTNIQQSANGRMRLVYEHNLSCDWLIRVLPDERISLRFLTFQLENENQLINSNRSRTCMFDYIEIFDGQTFESPSKGRFCGRIIPREIVSSSNFMRIKFRSDMSVSFGGFTAKFVSYF